MARLNKTFQPAQSVYFTSQGLKEAQTELNFLKNTKRAQIAERIQRAREFGDIAENAEYDAALDEQALVENRILYLEDVLKNAKVITEIIKSDFVVIGSTVTIDIDGTIDRFTIVGKVEADPAQKRISNESPLGLALLGSKAGEVVEVRAPIINYKCKILEIK